MKLDEAAGVMFYMARDGENFMKMQLHRVGLDGKNDVRLTDPKFNHTVATCGGGGGGGRGGGEGAAAAGSGACGISPDNKYFVDVYQTHDEAPATQMVDATSGKVVAQVAKSDLTKFNELGLKKVEFFTYKAADGVDRSLRDRSASRPRSIRPRSIRCSRPCTAGREAPSPMRTS